VYFLKKPWNILTVFIKKHLLKIADRSIDLLRSGKDNEKKTFDEKYEGLLKNNTLGIS